MRDLHEVGVQLGDHVPDSLGVLSQTFDGKLEFVKLGLVVSESSAHKLGELLEKCRLELVVITNAEVLHLADDLGTGVSKLNARGRLHLVVSLSERQDHTQVSEVAHAARLRHISHSFQNKLRLRKKESERVEHVDHRVLDLFPAEVRRQSFLVNGRVSAAVCQAGHPVLIRTHHAQKRFRALIVEHTVHSVVQIARL